MTVTQLADLGIDSSLSEVGRTLTDILCTYLNYDSESTNHKTSLPMAITQ